MSYLKNRSLGQKRSLQCSDIILIVVTSCHSRELCSGVRARPSTHSGCLIFPSLRELLRCEAALARLYCRTALLNIFAPRLPHLFTRLFHIPAVRDITLEHLQLLSNQLLAPPLPGKTWLEDCILVLVLHGDSRRPVVAMLTALRQPRYTVTIVI